MYGVTTQEDPEYPGILNIPDTVSRDLLWQHLILARKNVYWNIIISTANTNIV